MHLDLNPTEYQSRNQITAFGRRYISNLRESNSWQKKIRPNNQCIGARMPLMSTVKLPKAVLPNIKSRVPGYRCNKLRFSIFLVNFLFTANERN